MESAKSIIQSNLNNPALHGQVLEKLALSAGNLSKLSNPELLHYYASVCDLAGLDPRSRPFDYLNLNGKLILYANRGCTDQLRQIHGVNLTIKAREAVEGCYIVTAMATLPSGRTDESIGAVSLDGLKGDSRSNAMMKAETKAKRRVTLSICGLALMDESEVESVRGAVPAAEEPPPAEKPWRTFKEMLECFATVKLELPEEIYYRILKAHGAEHANQFKDPRIALAAYQELMTANFPPAAQDVTPQ